MSTKWLVGIIMMYCIGVVICGIIEYFYFTQGATNTLFELMSNVRGISFSNPLTAVVDILIAVWNITLVIFRVLIWDFSFFAGDYAIIKYVFLWPLSIGFFISFLFAVRGTSSA